MLVLRNVEDVAGGSCRGPPVGAWKATWMDDADDVEDCAQVQSEVDGAYFLPAPRGFNGARKV